MTEGFWECIALRLDSGTRRSDRGRTLLGGSPLRILRLSDAGARALDVLGGGEPVGPDRTRQLLARRLLDAGLAHPVPLASDIERSPADVGVVIPVRDHADDLSALLDALDAREAPIDIVVVDDGSADPDAVPRAVGDRARLIRSDTSRGPAAARNLGWRSTTAGLVVFVDADVLPMGDWLERVLAHFIDPQVGAAAPRIRGRRVSGSVLDRYEEHRSPLDLGPREGRVAPRTRISYVPTAAIAYRRSVLEETGGFDESLRVGEDVDLVWRTVAAGHTVRYEPGAEVTHRNRPSWPALIRQRLTYGSSAAALEVRHPGAVPAVELNVWSLVAWTLPVVGGVPGAVAGAVTTVATTSALVPKLQGRVDEPVREAVRLGGMGTAWAGRWLARTTVRSWLPIGLVAAVISRRARATMLVASVLPALLEWRETRPDLDPGRWVAASLVDDVAYCGGVWLGCWRAGSWRVLAPHLSGIPGLADRRPCTGRIRRGGSHLEATDA